MKTEEARAIVGLVMTLAHDARKRDGRSRINKTDSDYGWHKVWVNTEDPRSLAEWRSTVQKAANGVRHTNGTGELVKVKQPTFFDRYRQLATDFDYLGSDAWMAEAWGAAESTFGSIRSRLKKQGFSFVELEGKIFKVIARPLRTPVKPETSTTLAPAEPEPSTTQIPITFEPAAQTVNYLNQAREAARGQGTEAMLYGILCALIAIAERGTDGHL